MGRKILTVAVSIILFTALVVNACALTELAKGSKGDEVVALQEALANQGYLNGKADGDFGKMTEAAVLAFQKANGLPETGIADEATQSALQNREQDRLTNLILSSGSTGNDVTKLQNRLIELGFLTGKASGTYDVNTEAAMVVFQSRNGLTPNGVADKAARDVLYADDARGINDPAVEVAPATLPTNSTDTKQSTGQNSGLISTEESFIIERLKLVPEVASIGAATEDHDPNNQLNKQGGYTAQVYFSSTLVTPNAGNRTPDQVIDDGTEGGGSIEVYKTSGDAERRNTYLSGFDGTVFASGSHTVMDTCVIRISSRLTASEQAALESSIIEALTLDEAEAASRATDATLVNEMAEPESNQEEIGQGTDGAEAKPSEEELSGPDQKQPSETSTEMVTVKEFGFVPVNGYYYYSVILHNNLTDMAIQFPEIRITARGNDGALISADSQVMNVMYPDQELVWAGLGGSVDEIPASIDIEFVEPTDNWHIVKPSSLEHAEYQPLEVKSARIKQDNFFPAVIGEIYNPNPYDLSMVAVTVIFRDGQGNLLAGDTGFVNGLKAEKTTAFEINVSKDLITDYFEVYGQPW